MNEIKRDYSFSAFESTITYAIDEYSDDNIYSITNDINLNESTFFSDIYLSRSTVENKLQTEILKDQIQLVIIGNPGTGKTTVLRKVLLDLEQNDNVFPLLIDFKKVAGINNSENTKFEVLFDFVQDKLKGRLRTYLDSLGKTDNDVVDFIVRDEKYLSSEDFDNDIFNDNLNDLQNIFDFDNTDNSLTFIQWFEDQRSSKRSNEFREKFLTISRSLKPIDYFRFIAFKLGQQCILAFDNVDSIIDNQIRDTFCQFFRLYQGTLKSSVKSILTMRSANPSITSLKDFGSYILSEFFIDYEDLIQKDVYKKKISYIKESNGFCSEQDKENIKRELRKSGSEKFAKSIYERRVNFVKKVINSETIKSIESKSEDDTISIESIKELEKISNILLDTDRLRIAFLDLCNFDRREMLIHIINFIFYLKNEINLDLDLLVSEKSKLQFILESYFYGWSTTKNIFVPDDIYNVPRDVQNWIDNNQTELECSIDHLILTSIFNLSKQSIRDGFSYKKKTVVSKVLENLGELGYNPEQIKKRLFYIIKVDKHGFVDRGLVELSHFVDLTRPEDINDNDEILLTPRAFYLLCYSHLKFISLISQIRSSRIKVENKIFKYNDNQPVTNVTIYAFLRMLCHMAHMHLKALNTIRTKLIKNGHKDWLTYYRNSFCLKANFKDKPFDDDAPNLMFLNILNSCVRFLEKDARIDEHQQSSYNEFIGPVLTNLSEFYVKNVKLINEDSYSELTGEEIMKAVNLIDFTQKDNPK